MEEVINNYPGDLSNWDFEPAEPEETADLCPVCLDGYLLKEPVNNGGELVYTYTCRNCGMTESE